MKFLPFFVAFSLTLTATASHAADAGIFSIVEGQARVLRGTTWYRLFPGARVQAGDILVGNAAGQIQVEFTAGGRFNLGTPGTLFVAVAPIAGDKSAGSMEVALPDGWLKVAAAPPSSGFKVQFDSASLVATEGIVVAHAQPGGLEFFVESGTARLSESEQGAARAATADTYLKAGEFAALSSELPPRVERRAPAKFVTGIPRQLVDPLPKLAPKYKAARGQLVAEQEVTFAEAEPWLTGPYRKLFLKRFQPRLKDRAFRAGVEAHIARYPEWDRLLHPEKYLPKTPVTPK